MLNQNLRSSNDMVSGQLSIAQNKISSFLGGSSSDEDVERDLEMELTNCRAEILSLNEKLVQVNSSTFVVFVARIIE